jgi:hypothetical protein
MQKIVAIFLNFFLFFYLVIMCRRLISTVEKDISTDISDSGEDICVSMEDIEKRLYLLRSPNDAINPTTFMLNG